MLKLPAIHPCFLWFLLLFTSCSGQEQSLSEQRAVLTSAQVVDDGTSIALAWEASSSSGGFTIYRRPMGFTSWGAALATLPASATRYTDSDLQPGIAYEYRITRSSGASAASGYVSSGIDLPPVEERGVMLLVVESALNDALASSIAQLEMDLLSDGWFTERIVVQATDTPASVRELIIAAYTNDPEKVKAVHILGHVPVPYTGDQAPDGHQYHRGAWACDGFYGDVDGVWTDASVTSTGSTWTWNHNVPGDGKMDQNSFPGALKLQVGRVDLSDLPSFSESESILTEAYLAKAHSFKTGRLRVPERAVIWDNLQWTKYPLSVSAYMAFAPCVGAEQVLQLPNTVPFSQHFLANDDLFTFQSGAGALGPDEATFQGTDGITTAQLPGSTGGGVFNMAVGSFFGDWDNPDNFLRAVLARGNALVHVWSGLPNWFLHPLAMGETIGYCALRTQNNTPNDYALANGGWQGPGMGRTHLGLMGDPSLRLRYVAPPTDLVVTNDQKYTTFSWKPSPDTVDGYLIYRIDEALRTIERMSVEPVSGNSVTLPIPFEPDVRYMVRALFLRTTPSGSYQDLSLGAQASSTGM